MKLFPAFLRPEEPWHNAQPHAYSYTSASNRRRITTTKHSTRLSTHTQEREHNPPCRSSAHPESSAPRADSSKSSPASPRPQYSSDRSPPPPRAGAATHTATTTTLRPAGSLASSLARSLRRRAGRTSSSTASSALSLSALLATGSSRTPGRFWEYRYIHTVAQQSLTFTAAFRLGLSRRHGDAWKPRASWRTPRRSNRWNTVGSWGG